MHLDKALEFVKTNSSDPFDLVRLDHTLHNKLPKDDQLFDITSTQRSDGGWAPFWAEGVSSVDATCYRLALLEQAGVKQHRVIDNALKFLHRHLHEGSYYEEDHSLRDVCPPWAKPEDKKARLYLTSNCAFWTNYYTSTVDENIINYLIEHIDCTGKIESYLHTKWLIAGLFIQKNLGEKAKIVLASLETEITNMSADNLAWMINTLLISGLSKEEPLVNHAVIRLSELQLADGSWISDDGEWKSVHTTLESIRAIHFIRNDIDLYQK